MPVQRTPRLRGLFLAFLVFVLAIPSTISASSIGLYVDANGSSCSFSGNTPGVVTAYVVVKPDAQGLRGVRFSAPIPSCLGAVWVGEMVPEGALAIGSSQEGVSVALPFCADAPIHVLQINYYRSSTDACCEFAIAPDPYGGIIEGTDCNYDQATMVPATSRFNADVSCPCIDPNAPRPPHSPSPPDQANAMSVMTGFAWSHSPYDFDIVEYDLYLGTTTTPELVATVMAPTYTPPQPFPELTQFYWRVVLRDVDGFETAGPLWTFRTRAVNSPPNPVLLRDPPNQGTGVSAAPVLRWMGSDIDNDPLGFDVYLGTGTDLHLVLANFPGTAWQVTPRLEYATTYNWYVVSRDPQGHESTSETWAFTTRPENYPPNPPWGPSPANNSTTAPISTTLQWGASDPDQGEPLTYDVYFGVTSPPPLVSSNQAVRSYAVAGLGYVSRYYWKVTVRDSHGVEAPGDEWTFFTRPENYPPVVPYDPSPGQNAVNVPIVTTLRWFCSDPDGHAIKYDVYFGTTATPPLVASNISAKYYATPPMPFLTDVYWRIVARDAPGAETSGPVWHYVTSANHPPGTPSNPSPSNASTNRGINTTLTWRASDADGEALKYDVYFGTSTSPPLVAADLTTTSYVPGLLAFDTLYRWKIVARDPQGLTTSGPLWTFTTKANSPPTVSSPYPANGGFVTSHPTLSWVGQDQDQQPLTFSVYYGTTNPPPLVASGLSSPPYVPESFALGSQYYWRVSATDGIATTSGSVWTFIGATRGDVNHDGAITLADASCALEMACLDYYCGGMTAYDLADVNCASGVTPRDALCIHRRAIGQGCPFCGEAAIAASPASPPVVTEVLHWTAGSTFHVVLSVANVSSFEAFSFFVQMPAAVTGVEAVRQGATGGFTAIEVNSQSGYAVVGGYTLAPVDASSAVGLIELRFAFDGWLSGGLSLDGFQDDLAGAAPLTILPGGGEVPVAISRFDATLQNAAVRLTWALESDEGMTGYVLYRHVQDASNAVVIAGGAAGKTGSYVDHAVEPGKTYRYDLLVRMDNGDEFRSQPATVEIPSLELSLGANRPNPFNPQTTIPYVVPQGSAPVHVKLIVYDTSGRLVRVLVDEDQSGGAREVVWRGDDAGGGAVTSGVYFCVLQVDKERRTRKLILLK